jgi:hypothetical protein
MDSDDGRCTEMVLEGYMWQIQTQNADYARHAERVLIEYFAHEQRMFRHISFRRNRGVYRTRNDEGVHSTYSEHKCYKERDPHAQRTVSTGLRGGWFRISKNRTRSSYISII